MAHILPVTISADAYFRYASRMVLQSLISMNTLHYYLLYRKHQYSMQHYVIILMFIDQVLNTLQAQITFRTSWTKTNYSKKKMEQLRHRCG